MRESLVIGLPPFLINLCACMVTIFITRSMTQYGGDVAVGAYGISNRLILFVVMIVIGLNQGMQPIGAETFATLFAKDAPELIAAATKGLHVATLFFPIIGMQIVSTAFFQSIGMPGKSIFLSLTRQLIFLLPAILILPHVFNDKVLGVWTALPTADCASCVVSAIMMVVQLRKFRRKAELAKEQAALQPEAE